MKLNNADISVMIVTCTPTKSGKGYLLSVLQGENHLKIFSKTPILSLIMRQSFLLISAIIDSP